MSTEEAVEERVDILADLSEDIPCDCYGDECARPAVWGMHLSCCGVQATACNPCKQQAEVAILQRKLYGVPLKCGICHTSNVQTSWRKL